MININLLLNSALIPIPVSSEREFYSHTRHLVKKIQHSWNCPPVVVLPISEVGQHVTSVQHEICDNCIKLIALTWGFCASPGPEADYLFY